MGLGFRGIFNPFSACRAAFRYFFLPRFPGWKFDLGWNPTDYAFDAPLNHKFSFFRLFLEGGKRPTQCLARVLFFVWLFSTWIRSSILLCMQRNDQSSKNAHVRRLSIVQHNTMYETTASANTFMHRPALFSHSSSSGLWTHSADVQFSHMRIPAFCFCCIKRDFRRAFSKAAHTHIRRNMCRDIGTRPRTVYLNVR